MKKETKEELKKRLTDVQWEVTQNARTERPYTNEYDNHFERGIYVDIVDNKPLFVSSAKYDSGCGWPAFSNPIDEEVIIHLEDNKYEMQRIEVRSAKADSHLGHVFNDGQKESGGLRYCTNSASLKFIPFNEMDEKGYGKFKDLV